MNLLPMLKTAYTSVKKFAVKNAPTILTGISAGGTVTAVIFAVKATPKAEKLIEKRKEELLVNRLPPVEIIKTCWPVYIPTAGMTLMSIVCGISANSINLKRNAALAGLYATTEQTLKAYQQKVVDTIGEEAEKDIREKLGKEQPEVKTETLVRPIMPKGLFKFEDSELFYATLADIYRAENRLNRRIFCGQEMFVSYGEIMDECDAEYDHSNYKVSDFGLTIDDGGVIFCFEPKMSREGECYTLITFDEGHEPHNDYRRIF